MFPLRVSWDSPLSQASQNPKHCFELCFRWEIAEILLFHKYAETLNGASALNCASELPEILLFHKHVRTQTYSFQLLSSPRLFSCTRMQKNSEFCFELCLLSCSWNSAIFLSALELCVYFFQRMYAQKSLGSTIFCNRCWEGANGFQSWISRKDRGKP
jgi:hypothetical protein